MHAMTKAILKAADKAKLANCAPYILAVSTIIVTGCDALLDLAIDCIDHDGPEFRRTLLVSPVLDCHQVSRQRKSADD